MASYMIAAYYDESCNSLSLFEDLRECYKEYLTKEENTPAKALLKIFDKTQKQFIFIIDEWDAIFRELPNNEIEQKAFLDFFRSLFKNGDTSSSIALCYMTGILPIKKYNTELALNNFKEFTMLKPFFVAPYIGFTEEEVKPLCQKFDMPFSDIKSRYEGYEFKGVGSIYSPFSVVNALTDHEINNYWIEIGRAHV